jgi:hypothetical protein
MAAIETRFPEWELMYRKGLTAGQIAELCGVAPQKVRRHIRAQQATQSGLRVGHESNLPHVAPAPPRASWLAKVAELSALWERDGRYPSRLGHWLSVQRRAHRKGC